MTFIAWIALGVIAGFVSSKIINPRGDGLLLDAGIGGVGGFLGGFLFEDLLGHAMHGFNLHSLGMAVSGAIVTLISYHLLFGLVNSDWSHGE